MESEEKKELVSETQPESKEETTITLKKSRLLTVIGAVIMISFFIFVAQAMIVNANTPQNNNYGNGATANTVKNAIGSVAPLQGEKQIIKLSMQNGNYYPNTIRLKKGVPTVIEVDTNSVRGCYRGIQIPAFNVKKLTTSSDNKIEFTPDKAGTFGFSCFMGMGTGQLIVEDEAGKVPSVNTVAQDIPKGGSCGAGGGCGCGG